MNNPGLDRVRSLADAATRADGVSPLDDQVLLQLKYGDDDVRHVTVLVDGELVGYGHLDLGAGKSGEAVAKVVVHPDHRRRGIGGDLVKQLVDLAAPSALSLWAHGRHPGAAQLASLLGFSVVRELWKMRRDLTTALPTPAVPEGVTIRTFAAGDEMAIVDVNAAAFAGHPEQGTMTLDNLHRRMAEPWFDPAGLFVAVRGLDLLGFHWTKVHGRGPGAPFGEVYVVGVSPSAQGLGLGKALTLEGLRHLRASGLTSVRLYVEADNAPAVAVYTRLGFEHFDTDVLYRRTP
ncbi:MAG: mycothiol synthase [Nocardioidaceae bacterium]